jgi:anti-sigma B factor antagonist
VFVRRRSSSTTGPQRVRVTLAGEIDVATSPLAQAQLGAAIMDHPGVEIIVDMSGVSFIDGRGVGMLYNAHRRATASGGDLRLNNIDPRTRKVLTLTGLDRLFLDLLASPMPEAGGPLEPTGLET